MSGPAWSNQVQNKVIVGGSKAGVFVYNGTPGPGNTPIAWMTNQTTDPYGNVLPANDIVSYATATTAYAALQAAAALFGKAGLTSPARIGLLSAVPAAGILALTSSQVGISDTVCTFYLESSNQTGGPFAGVDKIVAWQPGTTPGTTPETWHTLSLAAGWTTVAGHPLPSYQLLPDGNVQMVGYATHAGFTVATALSTTGAVPAAYRPATQMTIAGITDTTVGILISASGTVTAIPFSVATAAGVEYSGTYPVNL